MKGKTIKSRDGQKLYYETGSPPTGRRTNSASLFFSHGLGGDLDAWQFIIKPLQEQGFSTIAMDMRSHGYSSHPKFKESYKLNHFVEDIEDIIAAEKLLKVTVIGHSFGATVASLFSLKNPKHTEKLILLSTNYYPPAYISSGLKKKFSSLITSAGAALSPPPTAGWHSPYPKGKYHKDIEWFGLARTIYHNSLKSYLLTSSRIKNINLLKDLPKIKVPTLVVVGDKDSLYPYPASKIVHEKIPGSKFAVIKGANHVLPMNNPKEITKLIADFSF